jgi:hypothetical protein
MMVVVVVVLVGWQTKGLVFDSWHSGHFSHLQSVQNDFRAHTQSFVQQVLYFSVHFYYFLFQNGVCSKIGTTFFLVSPFDSSGFTELS